ncbi:hypothetical protein Psi02_49910 [Planotetraspora silvatica]|uniref:Uncharacterized protein n=1 Tax=Planotetraspora silvatica TaxID=234614 RepID=A0A8J3URM4_9ACTN|nr:hypothetical protein Psi02_49910 [Planotetraspora silvatica]
MGRLRVPDRFLTTLAHRVRHAESGRTYADDDQPAESTMNKIDNDCTMEAFGGRD